MESFFALASFGFEQCLLPLNIVCMVIGTALGIIIGALPGLSATTGMVILLPLTYGFPVEAGMLTLGGVFCGALYGSSIPAILLGIPGTAASLTTTFDGYPLCQKGQAPYALLLALYGSAVGGMASSIVLLTLTPLIAHWALKFGPPEIFAIALWGMAVVSSIIDENPLKGIFMAAVGLLISTIGADPFEGYNRFTFDSYHLLGGLHFVPIILGTLAIPKVFDMVMSTMGKEKRPIVEAAKAKRKYYLTPREVFPYTVTMIKSSVIGVIIGVAPAAGPTIAALISYNEAKRSAGPSDEFGKGNPKGVVASETANNGATGGDLVLTLALGIPGGPAAAVLLGALIMKGIQPGPMLMQTNAGTVYTFLVGFLLVNIIVFFLGHIFVQLGYSILKIPTHYLAPLILATCFLGAYVVENDMFNVYTMLGIGIIAFFMSKLDFPMPPLILGLILGPLMESNYGISLRISFGDYMIFFTRPMAAFFLLVAIATFLWPLWPLYQERQKKKKEAAEAGGEA